MAQIDNFLPILTEAVLDADTHRLNFNNFKSKYNQHDRNKVGVHGMDSVNTLMSESEVALVFDSFFPVGTVIQVWDNNIGAIKALVDSEYMVCMEGGTVSDVDSLLNGVTLPDISEAYLMGSLENINATKVGDNKGELTHSHTLEHIHTSTHTHTIPSHTHSISCNDTYLMTKGTSEFYVNQTSGANAFLATHYKSTTVTYSVGNTTTEYVDANVSGSGLTIAGSGANSGASIVQGEIVTDGVTYSGNRQLRSIRCRYYIRIK
jgi:hypothetical protein